MEGILLVPVNTPAPITTKLPARLNSTREAQDLLRIAHPQIGNAARDHKLTSSRQQPQLDTLRQHRDQGQHMLLPRQPLQHLQYRILLTTPRHPHWADPPPRPTRYNLPFHHPPSRPNHRLRRKQPNAGLLTYCIAIWSLARARTDKSALPLAENPRVTNNNRHRAARASARNLLASASCYGMTPSILPNCKKKSMS